MPSNKAPTVLAICGSLRQGSTNRKILDMAVAGARSAGADVVEVDLRDYPMAPYNEDDQNRDGLPATAVRLRRMVFDCDGLLLAVPEYNRSLPGGFKNIIDWISRRDAQGPLSVCCFKGKYVALMAASSGIGGGRRALDEMRLIMTTFGSHVLTEQVSLPSARAVFDGGGPTDPKLRPTVEALGARLIQVIDAFRSR